MRVDRSRFRRRLLHGLGLLCVVGTFALLSPGVRIVRAADERESRADEVATAVHPQAGPMSRMSEPVPPPVPEAPPAASPASPFVRAEDVENARRPGVSGIETSPGVVVLNTRGYNYGPPPTPLEPEALRQESEPR
ncbi:MAG: hypothetical protein R3F35_23200 [Myxococcota bacterium]